MWYAGLDEEWKTAIGYATFPDGVYWTRYPANPVLHRGPSGSWDSDRVYKPCVIQNGTAYEMWYWGTGSSGEAIGHAVAEPGGWITGSVSKDGSGPLTGATIHSLDGDLNIIAGALSEGDGTYALVDLPADDYHVVASLDGYGREYHMDAPDIASATEVSVTVPIITCAGRKHSSVRRSADQGG